MSNAGLSDSVMSVENYVYKAPSIHSVASDPLTLIAYNSLQYTLIAADKQQILIMNLNKNWHEIFRQYCDIVYIQYYLRYLNEILIKQFLITWLRLFLFV